MPSFVFLSDFCMCVFLLLALPHLGVLVFVASFGSVYAVPITRPQRIAIHAQTNLSQRSAASDSPSKVLENIGA